MTTLDSVLNIQKELSDYTVIMSDNSLKELNNITFGTRCHFYGSNYIFKGCSFDEFPIFESECNTFENCFYMERLMRTINPVQVVHFQLLSKILKPMQCVLTVIRCEDGCTHVYFMNLTTRLVVRSYEDFPVHTGLCWTGGCIRNYINAMYSNFKHNEETVKNASKNR